MKTDPESSGVYAIRCTETKKWYVGSAAYSFKRRWRDHRIKLRNGKHENSYLQAAWCKHGESAFEFSILEECESAKCLVREQFWIDEKRATLRDFGYNICPTAGSALGAKRDPEETKVKVAQRRALTCPPDQPDRIGFFTVIERRKCRRGFFVTVRCDCGKELRLGLSGLKKRRSCGCGIGHSNHSASAQAKRMVQRRPHDGKSCSHATEHSAWSSMIQRCTNPNHPKYQLHVNRAISVCQEWTESFDAFLRDVGLRPDPAMRLGRIDDDKGYFPGNCAWMTHGERMRNSRRVVIVEHQGRRACLTEWARELDISVRALKNRIKKWGIDRAISTPVPDIQGARRLTSSPI